MEKKFLNKGDIFGDLKVVEYQGVVNKSVRYLCVCLCGKTRIVRATELRTGKITHCGCKNFVYKTHSNAVYSEEMASYRSKATQYRASAKTRKIDFQISIDEAVEMLKKNCGYCGVEPNTIHNVRLNRATKDKSTSYAYNNSEKHSIKYNGIDRINNKLGYTIENTITCCSQCNIAKAQFTQKEFKDWIKRVHDFNNMSD